MRQASQQSEPVPRPQGTSTMVANAPGHHYDKASVASVYAVVSNNMASLQRSALTGWSLSDPLGPLAAVRFELNVQEGLIPLPQL